MPSKPSAALARAAARTVPDALAHAHRRGGLRASRVQFKFNPWRGKGGASKHSISNKLEFREVRNRIREVRNSTRPRCCMLHTICSRSTTAR